MAASARSPRLQPLRATPSVPGPRPHLRAFAPKVRLDPARAPDIAPKRCSADQAGFLWGPEMKRIVRRLSTSGNTRQPVESGIVGDHLAKSNDAFVDKLRISAMRKGWFRPAPIMLGQIAQAGATF